MEKFLFEDLFEEILVRSKAQEYFSILESTKFFSSDFKFRFYYLYFLFKNFIRFIIIKFFTLIFLNYK